MEQSLPFTTVMPKTNKTLWSCSTINLFFFLPVIHLIYFSSLSILELINFLPVQWAMSSWNLFFFFLLMKRLFPPPCVSLQSVTNLRQTQKGFLAVKKGCVCSSQSRRSETWKVQLGLDPDKSNTVQWCEVVPFY